MSQIYTLEQIKELLKKYQADKAASMMAKKESNTYIARDEKAKARLEEKKKRQQVESIINMDMPINFENAFANDSDSDNIHCDSLEESLLTCLNNLGKVDIEYISKISGYSLQDSIKGLRGAILQNPETWGEVFYKGFELRDEYLVGNLKDKYIKANEANEKYPGLFKDNLEAIKSIADEKSRITSKEIYVSLSSPWLPKHFIKEFIKHLLGIDGVVVKYDSKTGSYSFDSSYVYTYTFRNRETYGTRRLSGLEIILRTLNQTEVVVKDPIPNQEGKFIKNEKETMYALEKQKLIIEEFNKWIFKDSRRKEYLTNIYNEKYCLNYTRQFDGSFLTFKDMNPDIKLFPHQRNAIARIIFSSNTLLAHDVGSGKTYEMIAAGHELKRMKQSKKNLFVVPNAIVGQWSDMYKYMYPNASILVVDPKSFAPSKRNEVLNDIKYNDYDGIIMAYSCFDLIPLSPNFYKEKLNRKVAELDASYANTNTRTRTVAMNRTQYHKGKYTKELMKIGENVPGTIYFDDLDIDRLFLDESHNYKNVPLDTNIHALGLSDSGSKKCSAMMDKCHFIQGKHDGKGIVFATGTPITNSLSDVYVIQKYLQPAQLNFLGLESFNSWISNFAESETNFEIDVDTSNYRMAKRYSKFHNLPELSSLLASIADFHKMNDAEDLPSFKGYQDVLIPRTDIFESFLKNVSKRAELIRQKRPLIIRPKMGDEPEVKDNMLLVTTDGRKAALDIRLFDERIPFDKQSKVYECANNVFKIYQDTKSFKGTQLIFSDVSTPKVGFNIYDEIKNLLVDKGVPSEEIAYIHSADTESKRKKLFDKVNKGDIRILLGSTFKLGTGVNVQERLYAIHHIDVPWRPSDMTQREGRIIRPGNTNKEVHIYRYITEQSFDAYSWQLLESKQNFISKMLSHSIYDRTASDIDDSVLNYAEVKALAIGNPLIKKRVEVANELARLKNLKGKANEKRSILLAKIDEIERRFPIWEETISKAEDDYKYIQSLDLSTLVNKDAKKGLAEKIYKGVTSNINSMKEVKVADVFDFKVISPSYQLNPTEELTIYLERNGKYPLRIGKSALGIITRINNYLCNFNKHIEELKSNYDKNYQYYVEGKKEIQVEDNYDKQIAKQQKLLDELDAQLGIKKEEK